MDIIHTNLNLKLWFIIVIAWHQEYATKTFTSKSNVSCYKSWLSVNMLSTTMPIFEPKQKAWCTIITIFKYHWAKNLNTLWYDDCRHWRVLLSFIATCPFSLYKTMLSLSFTEVDYTSLTTLSISNCYYTDNDSYFVWQLYHMKIK